MLCNFTYSVVYTCKKCYPKLSQIIKYVYQKTGRIIAFTFESRHMWKYPWMNSASLISFLSQDICGHFRTGSMSRDGAVFSLPWLKCIKVDTGVTSIWEENTPPFKLISSDMTSQSIPVLMLLFYLASYNVNHALILYQQLTMFVSTMIPSKYFTFDKCISCLCKNKHL